MSEDSKQEIRDIKSDYSDMNRPSFNIYQSGEILTSNFTQVHRVWSVLQEREQKEVYLLLVRCPFILCTSCIDSITKDNINKLNSSLYK
jgi:hypothetical protein